MTFQLLAGAKTARIGASAITRRDLSRTIALEVDRRHRAESGFIVVAKTVAEVGDFTRFSNPRQLMAYFGLVPGERSSAETIRRGGITKTGNAHARRALVEGAWAYRMKARIGRHKVDRIETLPKVVRDIGWKAQVRLCTRYRRLSARGKTANVVNVAIAREMVGFIWSIACTVQSAPKTA